MLNLNTVLITGFPVGLSRWEIDAIVGAFRENEGECKLLAIILVNRKLGLKLQFEKVSVAESISKKYDQTMFLGFAINASLHKDSEKDAQSESVNYNIPSPPYKIPSPPAIFYARQNIKEDSQKKGFYYDYKHQKRRVDFDDDEVDFDSSNQSLKEREDRDYKTPPFIPRKSVPNNNKPDLHRKPLHEMHWTENLSDFGLNGFWKKPSFEDDLNLPNVQIESETGETYKSNKVIESPKNSNIDNAFLPVQSRFKKRKSFDSLSPIKDQNDNVTNPTSPLSKVQHPKKPHFVPLSVQAKSKTKSNSFQTQKRFSDYAYELNKPNFHGFNGWRKRTINKDIAAQLINNQLSCKVKNVSKDLQTQFKDKVCNKDILPVVSLPNRNKSQDLPQESGLVDTSIEKEHEETGTRKSSFQLKKNVANVENSCRKRKINKILAAQLIGNQLSCKSRRYEDRLHESSPINESIADDTTQESNLLDSSIEKEDGESEVSDSRSFADFLNHITPVSSSDMSISSVEEAVVDTTQEDNTDADHVDALKKKHMYVYNDAVLSKNNDVLHFKCMHRSVDEQYSHIGKQMMKLLKYIPNDVDKEMLSSFQSDISNLKCVVKVLVSKNPDLKNRLFNSFKEIIFELAAPLFNNEEKMNYSI